MWLNTNTYDNVVKGYHSHVLEIVQGNSVLGPLFAVITSPEKQNEFLVKAAMGKIASNVPPIYFLGDTFQHV